jgi:hypothetical protein
MRYKKDYTSLFCKKIYKKVIISNIWLKLDEILVKIFSEKTNLLLIYFIGGLIEWMLLLGMLRSECMIRMMNIGKSGHRFVVW